MSLALIEVRLILRYVIHGLPLLMYPLHVLDYAPRVQVFLVLFVVEYARRHRQHHEQADLEDHLPPLVHLEDGFLVGTGAG